MDWQKRYIENDTPWDKNQAAPELVHRIHSESHLFNKVEKALVPGCGLGHDAFVLAEAGMNTIGFDISELALEQAAQRYQHAKLDWQHGDLFSDLADAEFDMVWEHTCFCAIPLEMRDAYVECMANTLKPGGFLLGVFFIETDLPEGEGPPFKASIEEIKTHFFNRFSLEYQATPDHHYSGREGKEQLMLFRRLGC